MNISELINDIKLSLGLNTVALPYDKPVESVIREIIQISIRTYSEFQPCIKEGYCDRNALASPNEFDKANGIYLLPAPLSTTHVKDADAYIASNKYKYGEVTSNAFTVGSPFVGFGSYYPQDILNATLTGAAINKYAGVTSTQPTSKYLGFNKIKLFDFPKNAYIRFVVKCEHDSNCESIPETCWESFKQLATLDVKVSLYNTIKNMNNVGSAFKEIQLKIDDWSGAESERNELVKEMTNTFHFDDPDLIQFF